ncbi:MAG: SBBP repeat-containing protein [Bacteroidia bacterium]|nr:SBBP repeat-containing protein [Bacteroidia bacterium]
MLYLYRGPGLDAWVTRYGLNLTFIKIEKPTLPLSPDLPFHERERLEREHTTLLGHRMLMELEGANLHPTSEGLDKKPGYYNYFIGNDPSKHASFVGLYGEARVKEVYPGISLRYYLEGGRLRYDYLVAPGADPSQIRFRIRGADEVEVRGQKLVFTTRFGSVELCELRAYQGEQRVPVQFVGEGGIYRIAVGAYDRSQPLVIDPLVYSTYLGGSGDDSGYGIAVDGSGRAYVVGVTQGSFPVTSNADQPTHRGIGDGFVAVLNAAGNCLLHSSYLGGSSSERVSSIAIGSGGEVYVAGTTSSPDFPTTAGSYDGTHDGDRDVFVTVLSVLPLRVEVIPLTNCRSPNGEIRIQGSCPGCTYTWIPNVGSGPVVTGLAPGIYTCIVQGVPSLCGGSTTETLRVEVPRVQLNVSATMVYPTRCQGSCNGSISVSVRGGTAPYSYQWSPGGQTTPTVNGLCPGLYRLTVTDAQGCSNDFTFALTSDPASITHTVTPTNGACPRCSGRARVQVSGGTPPYSYRWDTAAGGHTTSEVSGLCGGRYTVEVRDAGGCWWIDTVEVPVVNAPLVVDASVVQHPTQCGPCNGSAVVRVLNGIPPFQYEWSVRGVVQSGNQASGLCPGLYWVRVRDSAGCEGVDTIRLQAPTHPDTGVVVVSISAVDEANAAQDFAQYYRFQLPRRINPHPSNPRNLADPGRYVRFLVLSGNLRQDGRSIVSGSCHVRTSSPYVRLTDSVAAFNNLAWTQAVWSADEFEVYVDPGTPVGSEVYVDFLLREYNQVWRTPCIPIPIRPIVYSVPDEMTIDDDGNPDSQGNNNDLCEPGERIEFYPRLDNISSRRAQLVWGRLENLDGLSFISMWNNRPGVNTVVYDWSWWNYAFDRPQPIEAGARNMPPRFDFVFDYLRNGGVRDSFYLYLVVAGGFRLFYSSRVILIGGDTAGLSLVQWSLPYVFRRVPVAGVGGVGGEAGRYWRVYPNPAMGWCMVENGLGRVGFWEVVDRTGQVVAVWEGGEGIFVRAIALPAGVYIIRERGSGTVQRLVVVE